MSGRLPMAAVAGEAQRQAPVSRGEEGVQDVPSAARGIGFVDQLPQRQGLDAQGRRLANAVLAAEGGEGLAELQRFLRVMEKAERLSLSFRFESGTSAPDVQSRAYIETLARDIEAGLYDGRELVFAGFTDGEGPLDVNLRLSRARAEAIRDAVSRAAPLRAENAVTLTA
ncbi:MAG: hypothetical protein ACNA7M_17210, partial [Roseovarius sp.]